MSSSTEHLEVVKDYKLLSYSFFFSFATAQPRVDKIKHLASQQVLDLVGINRYDIIFVFVFVLFCFFFFFLYFFFFFFFSFGI